KELARTYTNLVEDSTRVMQRLKALFRARGIRTPGKQVYEVAERPDWLRQLSNEGVRFRAQTLYAELAALQELRPTAKQAMLREARGGIRRGPRYAAFRFSARSGGGAAGGAADPVAVSDQTAPLGLCRARGRSADDGRV